MYIKFKNASQVIGEYGNWIVLGTNDWKTIWSSLLIHKLICADLLVTHWFWIQILIKNT